MTETDGTRPEDEPDFELGDEFPRTMKLAYSDTHHRVMATNRGNWPVLVGSDGGVHLGQKVTLILPGETKPVTTPGGAYEDVGQLIELVGVNVANIKLPKKP